MKTYKLTDQWPEDLKGELAEWSEENKRYGVVLDDNTIWIPKYTVENNPDLFLPQKERNVRIIMDENHHSAKIAVFDKNGNAVMLDRYRIKDILEEGLNKQ